ncbi:MAG: segregation/condensation protein A [Deltaproteobacteria bacterium]|nr:segregation/condensation protein A [Deltaproteobacteria bacterium]
MEYEVKLEIFEGPLDLLIHLIYKNEVDIFDIPIAAITDQYLEYLEMMKALNMDVAGDFLVMASTLIHIKSKMLIPQRAEDMEGEDPRLEITRPLLEYMALKEAAEDLSQREILDRDVFVRQALPYPGSQMEDEEPRLDVSLFQLIDAFKRIMDQRLPGIQLKVQFEKWSVKEKAEIIMVRLQNKKALFFKELFSDDRTVSEFVVTFLALLELVHQGLVKIYQLNLESDIRLVPAFDDQDG